MEKTISKAVLKRLPVYLSYLKSLPEDGPENISATTLAAALNLGEVQVRKDLALVSDGGRPKVGYRRLGLIEDIQQFLGCDNTDDAVLVGAGKLGRALMGYSGFSEYGLNIVAAFDADVSRCGGEESGKPILPLSRLEEVCRKHNILILADEIHCEFDLENRHIPFFSLNEEAAQNSVTFSSAGKICNIPGLPMGFAIIPNEELRAKFISQQDGLQPAGNILTIAAYEKAYDGSCDEWKDGLRDYLRGNRDIAEARFNAIPGVRTGHNEGTYLLWVDCSALGLEDPAKFFLDNARVRVNSGAMYGDVQHIRFNYGCPRAQMVEAIDRTIAQLQPWLA